MRGPAAKRELGAMRATPLASLTQMTGDLLYTCTAMNVVNNVSNTASLSVLGK